MKKNFKRLLCLVLVVSLVCSLGVTAFAANSSLTNYTDVDEIQYIEAVDVLTGIGILEGSDGTFKPSDTMTRAEAAKIIAYLKLGAETASSLSATSAPFDDVPLTHWAVGYISYCASAGIVNGDGTGNFNPENEVTAYEFGKMLLTTLGYGVNGEYTGASWAVNVAAAAGSLGIYSGKSGSLSGNTAITRDEMALYAFNTLTGAAQVNYNSNFEEYYVGTSALNSISTTIKDKYKYEDYIDGDEDETAYEYTIGYQTYDLVKSGEKGGSSQDTDAFGRPCYTWESDDAEISDTYVDDESDYTISNNKEAQDIYSTIGSTIAGYTFYVYVDDDSPVDTDDTYGSYAVYNGEIGNEGFAAKNSDTKIVQRGSTLELYVNDSDKEVQAVIINEYLGQITDVDADSNDIEITLDVYGLDGIDELTIDSDKAANLAGFQEDDWVIVTWSAAEDDEAQSIVAATVVEGEATSWGTSKVTIDGTTYDCSYTFNSDHDQYDNFTSARDDKDYDTTYTIYVDTYGNMIGFEEADGSSSSSISTKKYLYAESAKATGYDGFDDAEVKVKATFTDGTTSTIYLKMNDEDTDDAYVKIAGETIYIDSSYDDDPLYDNDGDLVAGHIYSYTENSSGYYTLNKLGSTADEYYGVIVDDVSAVKLYTSSSGSRTTTLYANSSTRLVLVDDQKVYTGYSNFPDEDYDQSYTDMVLIIRASSGSTRLNYIYVFGDDVSSTDSLIYAMYTGSGDVQSTSNDTETAQFWVNGSKVTYEFDDGDIDSDWYKFQAGWIEIGSDGLAEFTPFDGTASDEYSTSYDKDNYMYFGYVTDKDSDSIDVDINGRSYVFSFADDYEKTRLKSGGSGSSSSPSAGDYVWVFTEDPADSSSDYTSEAIAVIAIDEGNSNISSLLSNIGYTAYSAE
ncbi:MAG: S-layer homology domain-containing protein [Oscillospiraceae bacterium]|nr:S-layer homology domain-containing protein [Oscillospiraceae bacterium]